MSQAVFPSFPGLAWNVSRKPIWSTVTKTSVSGRKYRSAQWSYPIWRYKLVYEVLRAEAALTEMQQMAGFFNARQGSFDSWLYTDPDDSAVTAQQFGTGNGVATQFQLLRSFGGYNEPVFDINGAPSIYINGVLKATPADYSIGSTGIVTFTAAPGNALPITWTGNFYWRCNFMADMLDFNQFMRQFWDLKTVEFETLKP